MHFIAILIVGALSYFGGSLVAFDWFEKYLPLGKDGEPNAFIGGKLSVIVGIIGFISFIIADTDVDFYLKITLTCFIINMFLIVYSASWIFGAMFGGDDVENDMKYARLVFSSLTAFILIWIVVKFF